MKKMFIRNNIILYIFFNFCSLRRITLVLLDLLDFLSLSVSKGCLFGFFLLLEDPFGFQALRFLHESLILDQEIVFCLLVGFGLAKELWIFKSISVDATFQDADF